MKERAGLTKTLGALLLAAGVAFASDYSSWARYRTVTLNTTSLGLGASVTSIPLLARFNPTSHKDMLDSTTQILANGADIRVTKADGTTDVPFEIEQATTGPTGSLALWIRADVAQNSATAATYRVYWGKAGATSLSNSAAVFDTTNGYLAVWHLNGNANDATAYGHNGTVGTYGTGTNPTDTLGIAGTAKRFTGLSNNTGTNGAFYTITPGTGATALSLNTNNGQYTLSAWVSPDGCSSSARMALVSKYANDGSNKTKAWALQTSGGSGNWRHVNNPVNLYNQTVRTGGANEFFSESPCTVNAWQYVTGSYKSNGVTAVDTLNADMAARLTATTNATGTTAPGTASQTITTIGDSADVLLGRLHGGSGAGGNLRFLRGALDEVRISRVARDSNWTKIEYETQRPAGGTALTIGAGTVNTAPSPYAAWTGHKTITLNTSATGANVPNNVTNFPVLVRLGSNEASIIAAANGGASIRFSKIDDATALPYEIDSWSSTAAAIWVKLDTVKGNSTTQQIRLHYGNGAATSQSSGSAVFDTANGFVGVWHLGNSSTATGTRPGSVIGSPAAVVRNAVAPVSGIIGMADTLDANGAANATIPTGRYIDLGRDSAFNNTNYAGFSNFTTGFSWTAWMQPTAISGFARLLMVGPDSAATAAGTNRFLFMMAQNNGISNIGQQANFAVRWSGLGTNYNSDTTTFGIKYNQWTNLTVTKIPGTTVLNIYKNGVLLGSTATATDAASTTRNLVWIGRSTATTDGYFSGKFDDFTLSKVARDSNWVKLSYQNQQAVNTLLDVGQPPVATVPDAPTAVTGVSGNAQVTVSWTAPVNNGGAAITGYKAMAVEDSAKTCSTTGALTCAVTGLTNGTAYTFVVRAINSVGSSVLSAASAAVTPAVPVGGAYSAWTGHRTIKLNTSASGANVAATVTNFPVLVRLGSAEAAILSAAKAGGADIRFSKTNDSTALPYQIESWSSSAAAIWVKVDSVKGNNATQTIRMHYGNSAATTQSSGSAVFDTAQYVAVWHLNDTLDATGNGNTAHASPTAPTDLAASIIGGGKTFDGATNWYQIGTDSTAVNLNTDTGPYTLSAWVNPASCAARIAAIAKYTNGSTPTGRQYALHTNGNFTDWRFTNGTTAVAGEFTADAPGTCVVGSWSHIVGTYKSGATPTTDSSVNAKIYVNGVLAGSGATVTIAGAGRSANTFIGRLHGAERYMNGSLDEITVAKVARDSNWIRLAYANQRTQNSLTDIGSMATVPDAPTGATATKSTTVTGTVTITWTAPANNGGSAITGYTVTGTPSGTCTSTGATTCTIAGLTVGTSYTFTVVATNGVGNSVASAASAAVTMTTGILGGTYMVHTDGFTHAYTFRLPAAAQTMTENLKMTITDVFGRTVWSSTISPKESQRREISWNGKNSKGTPVSAGMYIVRVKVDEAGVSHEFTNKATTLKPGK